MTFREGLRLASVRLAIAAGLLSSVLTAHPAILLGLIGIIPGGLGRYVVAGFVGLVVFAIPAIARLVGKETVAQNGK